MIEQKERYSGASSRAHRLCRILQKISEHVGCAPVYSCEKWFDNKRDDDCDNDEPMTSRFNVDRTDIFRIALQDITYDVQELTSLLEECFETMMQTHCTITQIDLRLMLLLLCESCYSFTNGDFDALMSIRELIYVWHRLHKYDRVHDITEVFGDFIVFVESNDECFNHHLNETSDELPLFSERTDIPWLDCKVFRAEFRHALKCDQLHPLSSTENRIAHFKLSHLHRSTRSHKGTKKYVHHMMLAVALLIGIVIGVHVITLSGIW